MITFFRTIILYVLVIIVMRLMGKRQIGQLQPYELVVTIMISDLASIPMQNTGIPLISGIIPIITILMMQIFISLVVLKSNKARKAVCGTAVMMIKDGKIIEENLKKEIFSLSDLLESARIEGYIDVSEIREAILETNGQLSVYGYDKMPVPFNVIMDGNYIEENIKSAGITKDRIQDIVSKKGAKDESSVLLCRYFSDGKWYIQLKGELKTI